MRLLFYDIEATNLDADFGNVICIGYQWLGQPTVHLISLTEFDAGCACCGRLLRPDDDKPVLKAFLRVAADAEAGCTWYGTRFDDRFLNARLLFHGLPPLPPIPALDGWETAWRRLQLSSNRLANLQRFLRLPVEKTPLTGPIWSRAKTGDRRAIRYIEAHCRQDVRVLVQVYERLRPFIVRHPPIGMDCPRCNGPLIRRGTALSRTRRYQRFQCRRCGGWTRSVQSESASRHVAL